MLKNKLMFKRNQVGIALWYRINRLLQRKYAPSRMMLGKTSITSYDNYELGALSCASIRTLNIRCGKCNRVLFRVIRVFPMVRDMRNIVVLGEEAWRENKWNAES